MVVLTKTDVVTFMFPERLWGPSKPELHKKFALKMKIQNYIQNRDAFIYANDIYNLNEAFFIVEGFLDWYLKQKENIDMPNITEKMKIELTEFFQEFESKLSDEVKLLIECSEIK